jgi:hypothetical protein
MLSLDLEVVADIDVAAPDTGADHIFTMGVNAPAFAARLLSVPR